MTKILDMAEAKRSLAAKRGFESWLTRFAEPFDQHLCLPDLSNTTLSILIQPGGDSSMIIYELIMGVKGLGKGPRFHFLENEDKMAVMDITLFLLDQLRFEAMRRLGWIEIYPTQTVPLVDLVLEFSQRFALDRHQTPNLSPAHPRYEEYLSTFEGDRAAFIRRLIPEVLQAFDDRVQNS